MARFQIFLLGSFETRVEDQAISLRLPKKAVGLLAYLAMRPGQPCSRDKLVDLLWGDGAPDQARHSLRQALLTLRRSLATTASRARIVSEGDTLALEAGGTDVAACGGMDITACGGIVTGVI